MDLELLERKLADDGEPRFRAGQVWDWAARGAGSYADMTNLPVELRERLPDEVPFSTLELEQEALAKDGTEKALFQTARRAAGRGGADALPRRPALALPVEPVRLPAHLHVLRHRAR